MGSMPLRHDATARPTRAITPSPSSPAEAFTQFVELIRKSPATLVGVPADDIFDLLLPFIVNPARYEAAVRAIAEAFGSAKVSISLAPMLKMIRWVPGNTKLKGTIEQFNPNLIERLRALETMLKTNLLPGSVVVHLKPVQYLESPKGYGLAELHRYRVIVQTLVDPSEGDALDAISIQLTATSDNAAEVVIDDISPQPGFSVVGIKDSSGAEHGIQETVSETESIKGVVSGGGAKISSGLETTQSVQVSTLISVGTERSLARVEQYLIARKAGNRATWRALAGVGPIDAGGIEYKADLLVPDSVQEILIRVEAKVDWMYAGSVPTDVQKTLLLPRPQRPSGKS